MYTLKFYRSCQAVYLNDHNNSYFYYNYMNAHFFPASMPAKGIITNLTICQSNGGEFRAHCYFNFHFPNHSKTGFASHCLFYELFLYYIVHLSMELFIPFFHSCRNSLYFIEIFHSSLIYYTNVFPNLLSFNVIYNVFGLPKIAQCIQSYIFIFSFIVSEWLDFVIDLPKHSTTT